MMGASTSEKQGRASSVVATGLTGGVLRQDAAEEPGAHGDPDEGVVDDLDDE